MDPRTTSHLDLSNVSCPLVKIHPVHHESNGRLSHPVYLHLLPGNQSKVIRICSWFEWYGQVRLWVRSPLVRVNIVNNVSSGWYDMKQDGEKLCLMNYTETYSRLITVNLLTYHFKSTEYILQIGSFLISINCSWVQILCQYGKIGQICLNQWFDIAYLAVWICILQCSRVQVFRTKMKKMLWVDFYWLVSFTC